ncbi:hypothetical protein [Alloscardovia omnicolens]|uniref:hypothetical protein n=1 Tax=Alloscardovia omnicolens TaxID=419015 RepID=UPI003A72568D
MNAINDIIVTLMLIDFLFVGVFLTVVTVIRTLEERKDKARQIEYEQRREQREIERDARDLEYHQARMRAYED